jgi:beta-galactosidase
MAELTKKKVGADKLVGTFYGYTFETPAKDTCHHSLDRVLECPDIDFLCSPVSYAKDRALGRDHGCMLPCDSLREHGKLYFAENDTRTHLTIVPYPDIPYFQNPVFKPKRFDDTAEMLKLHYARALVHGYAHWWFDMWGGWYADETYMSEMREFLEISRSAREKEMGSVSEIAVFIDEKCYKYGKNNSLAYNIRESLGLMGTPYDSYLASDFERVKDRYSAYTVVNPIRTATVDSIIASASEHGIPCLVITPDKADISPDELREFCISSGVHLYTDVPTVVYANESYIFVHAKGSELPKITPKNGEGLKALFEEKLGGVKHPDFVCEMYEKFDVFSI